MLKAAPSWEPLSAEIVYTLYILCLIYLAGKIRVMLMPYYILYVILYFILQVILHILHVILHILYVILHIASYLHTKIRNIIRIFYLAMS